MIMRLLEHQSRRLLAEFGLHFTDSAVITSPDQAVEAAKRLGNDVMIKAQVPFGGRGKSGAVRSATSAADVAREAEQLLGVQLRGVTVTELSVEVKVDFQRELYLGVAWDTANKLPVALLGISGGVDVEQSAQPVVRRTFDPSIGLSEEVAGEITDEAGLGGETLAAVSTTLVQLAQAFIACDAVIAEINPLVELADGQLIGVDAHLEIDDDAVYRQQSRLRSLGKVVSTSTGRPPTPLELEAQRIDAMDHRGVAGRVVEFDGDLALLIGGGGASLTLFDAVLRHGGKPANYCEIGGNPTPEKVAALTELLLSKPGVTRLAVIMNVVNNTRADLIASGVVSGVQKSGRLPAEVIVLFRVPGSWEQEAAEIMAGAGVPVCGREVSLDECARLAVQGGSIDAS